MPNALGTFLDEPSIPALNAALLHDTNQKKLVEHHENILNLF
jgi:hypothetical protein